MSGTTKVLLGCGIGCGFLMLLACGGVCVLAFSVGSYIKESATQDPAKIGTLTSDIVTIEIPPGLEPKAGFDAKMPITHAPFLIAAIYANEKQHSMLMLTEFQSDLFGKEGREGFQKKLEESMELKGNRQQQFQVKESKAHETTIHSEPAKFNVAKGVNESNKQEQWLVMGEFKGVEGPAIFVFQAPLEDYTEEQIIEMLDSMK
jgi:hypothetical protein